MSNRPDYAKGQTHLNVATICGCLRHEQRHKSSHKNSHHVQLPVMVWRKAVEAFENTRKMIGVVKAQGVAYFIDREAGCEKQIYCLIEFEPHNIFLRCNRVVLFEQAGHISHIYSTCIGDLRGGGKR